MLHSIRDILENHLLLSTEQKSLGAYMLAGLCSEALLSEHFEPGHFTASAFVLSPDRSKLLLIYHPKFHRWIQPGGHLEAFDKNIESAALRELREETGVEEVERGGVVQLALHRVPSKREKPAHEHWDLRFLFQAKTESLPSKELPAKWFPLVEIDDAISDQSVLSFIRDCSLRN